MEKGITGGAVREAEPAKDGARNFQSKFGILTGIVVLQREQSKQASEKGTKS